jgi:glutamate-1-semialdehyde 2,1-aminomutase
MSAARVARARPAAEDREVRGLLHGHADAFLVQAGSGVDVRHADILAVQPEPSARHCSRYNELPSVRALVHANPRRSRHHIEPVPGNMGMVRRNRLDGLRSICDRGASRFSMK